MTDSGELLKKLQVKPGARLWLVNAPTRIAEIVAADSEVETSKSAEKCDGAILFADSPADVERLATQMRKAIPRDGVVWFAYRKGSVAKKVGLSRDSGWEPLRQAGWDTVRSISIDDEWTGLRFRPSDLIKR